MKIGFRYLFIFCLLIGQGLGHIFFPPLKEHITYPESVSCYNPFKAKILEFSFKEHLNRMGMPLICLKH
jgi:hypothetical protein